jgi:demethylmenaquinone methyltransferase/2-methoxy-6-polyprenyl-1,4-benzoquinol methylase
MGNPKVSVVITGLEARFYDEMLDIVTLFQYGRFIKKLMYEETEVEPGYRVAELGVGNGRNAILLAQRVGERGLVIGFDISEDMLKKARKKTERYGNIKIVKHDIRNDFEYENYFDVALIALAFHGFTPQDRTKIMENVRKILKDGGKFYILDYNQMDYSKAPFYFKILIDKFECPLAEEFLSYDLVGEAERYGFTLTKKREYVKGLFQYSEFTLNK